MLFPIIYRNVQHTPKKHSSRPLFVTKLVMTAIKISIARNSPRIIRITFFTSARL